MLGLLELATNLDHETGFAQYKQERIFVHRFRNFLYSSSLSPGQTDRQVVASGRKLNLRRDLRSVAKRTRKFPPKYTQVAKKNILSSILLANNRLMGRHSTCVDLGSVAKRWKTCVQIWSRPKRAQVIASQRKCT